jgi:predicted permease
MPLARWRYTLPLRLRSLFRRDKVEHELNDELLFHIDRQIDEHMARGMKRDEARTAALRAMGGLDQRKEECRDARGVRLIEDFVGDLRYALRMMRRAPSFTVVAVLSLALGIGANTAIFSLLDALLLKSLPVHDPHQLYELRGTAHNPVYQTIRQHNRWFVDLFATSGVSRLDVEVGNAMPERTSVSLVTGSYFSVLGVQPFMGRTFTTADDQVPGGHPVAVASFGYWQRRFARDPDVVGRTVRITGTSITIIGVTPPGFFGERVGAAPDLWVPLTMWGQVVPGRNLLRSPGTGWLTLVGRVKPGISIPEAEAALTALFRQFLLGMLGPNMADDDRRDFARAAVTLAPAHNGLSSLRAQFSRPLQILMAVVALVLLIACANVANLLLARAATRTREIGVRLAIGMGRRRLIRQLTTEGLLLGAMGGLAGLALAWWIREGLLRLVSDDGSRLPLAVTMDTRLLLFVAALALATGVVFGLAPCWQATRVDLVRSVGRVRQSHSGGGRLGLNSLLVVGQVALSLVLVAGAGLFLRTLANLRGVDLGFAPDRLLIVDVDRSAAYPGTEYAALCRRLVQRMTTLAGVESVTFSENGALGGRDSSTNRMRRDDFVPGAEGIPHAQYDIVGPEYFGTMGISRLRGRDIDARDDGTAPPVVAINEQMARRFFGNANPLGRRMRWGYGDGQRDMEIVAVVRDVKQRGPRDDAELRFYVPYFQHAGRELASARFILRTNASPDAVVDRLRQAVRAEDARLSIGSIEVATDLFDRALVRERLVAALSAAFGTLAVVLACVGLYGVLAYRVARRTSEIGVRMAFGAARRTVLMMIVRQDLALVAAGIVVGAPLALAASRYAQGVLFGVSADDAPTLLAAILAITVAGLLAGAAPAWRAMRIEPAAALRHE